MIQRQEEGCRETGYANGQSVWVTDHTAQAGGKRKLGMRYKGPGKVVRLEGPNETGVVYRVRMPDEKEVSVHHNHLKPVKERHQDNDGSRSSEQTGDDPTITETEEDEKISDLIWALEPSDKSKVDEEPRYVTRYGRRVEPVQKYQA